MDIKRVVSLLVACEKASNFEAPAALIAIAAAIPGLLDESLLGLGAAAVFVGLALFRIYLRHKRNAIAQRLENEQAAGNLTDEEFEKALKALNTLTVAGGESN